MRISGDDEKHVYANKAARKPRFIRERVKDHNRKHSHRPQSVDIGAIVVGASNCVDRCSHLAICLMSALHVGPPATNRMSRTNSSARNFELSPTLGGGPNVRFGVICGRTAKPCGPDTRCWCQAAGDVAIPTGLRKIFNPSATEARGIRLRGERGISRKPTAQGMPGCSRCTYMLVCASLALFAHGTAGAAGTRHSLRPLLLGG